MADERQSRISLERDIAQLQRQIADLKASRAEDLRPDTGQLEDAARYRAAFEDGAIGVAIVELDSRITKANGALCRFLGYTETELVGKTFAEVTHPDDISANVELAERLFAGEIRSYTLERRYISKKQETVWGQITATLVRDSEGTALYGLGMVEDISQRKLAEDALKLALEELEKLRDQLQADNVYLQKEIRLVHDFERIIGHSKGLERALREVEQVAPTASTVLLMGETGTGKELFARAIHDLSPRKPRPLIIVNCAALPATLVESELFGHEKGAFTGATAQKPGRFELADGGTLFLDEVADVPLELQGKLLRALQEGEFERVGGTETLRVDVRIIAATNRDLGRAVAEGKFRADLYYRLDVFPIDIPPLRERKGDISILAKHFAVKHGKRLNKNIEIISTRMLVRLEDYSWPGNVRELENVIERALILAQGPMLELREPRGTPAVAVPVAGKTRSLEEVEHDHILRVVEETDWVIEGKQGAALILGLPSSSLRSKMKRLGIRRPGRAGRLT